MRMNSFGAFASGLLFTCFVLLTGFVTADPADVRGSAAADGQLVGRVQASPAAPVRDPATLERKLHGTWSGRGPCDGNIALRADGTYERIHYGPGNKTVAGTWAVRWDALPPTLVLACKTSDDPESIGKTGNVKLVQLDDEGLGYQYSENPKQTRRYSRLRE